MPPSGIRGGLAGSEGSYLAEHELNGFTRPSSPSMKRGETVQGGALRTFPLDCSYVIREEQLVNSVEYKIDQVTISIVLPLDYNVYTDTISISVEESLSSVSINVSPRVSNL